MKLSTHHLLLFGAFALSFVSSLPAPALPQIDVRSVEVLARMNVPAVPAPPTKQQVKQKVVDTAKQKAEDKAKKTAIKVGVKTAAKVATAVTGAAIPGVGEIVEVAQMVEQVIELIVGAIENAVKEDHAVCELLGLPLCTC